MHVVRSPVARAAAAIGTRTRYRGSAARGRRRVFPRPVRLGNIFAGCPVGSDTQQKCSRVAGTGCGPPRHRVQLISAVWDLTSPVKIYIIIIVHIHRNEHEFYCVKSLWHECVVPRRLAPSPLGVGRRQCYVRWGRRERSARTAAHR
jgi:hypothetical protein